MSDISDTTVSCLIYGGLTAWLVALLLAHIASERWERLPWLMREAVSGLVLVLCFACGLLVTIGLAAGFQLASTGPQGLALWTICVAICCFTGYWCAVQLPQMADQGSKL